MHLCFSYIFICKWEIFFKYECIERSYHNNCSRETVRPLSYGINGILSTRFLFPNCSRDGTEHSSGIGVVIQYRFAADYQRLQNNVSWLKVSKTAAHWTASKEVRVYEIFFLTLSLQRKRIRHMTQFCRSALNNLLSPCSLSSTDFHILYRFLCFSSAKSLPVLEV